MKRREVSSGYIRSLSVELRKKKKKKKKKKKEKKKKKVIAMASPSSFGHKLTWQVYLETCCLDQQQLQEHDHHLSSSPTSPPW